MAKRHWHRRINYLWTPVPNFRSIAVIFKAIPPPKQKIPRIHLSYLMTQFLQHRVVHLVLNAFCEIVRIFLRLSVTIRLFHLFFFTERDDVLLVVMYNCSLFYRIKAKQQATHGTYKYYTKLCYA
jgi:hypothetical protein